MGLVEKYRLADGEVIYYLTEVGFNEANSLAAMRLNFETSRGSLYRFMRPRTDKEKTSFIHFPCPDISFARFKPSKLRSYHFVHSRSMVEFLYLVRRSNRVAYTILLDMVSSKPSAFHIKSFPDILLVNDIRDSEKRVLIEFENSLIWEQSLYSKLHNLASETARFVVFLCADERILKNFMNTLYRVMNPDKKGKKAKRLLTIEAMKTVRERTLVGLWRPSFSNNGTVHKLSEIDLMPYSDEVFKPGEWVQKKVDGQLKKDAFSNPVMEFRETKEGGEVLPFVSILNEFQPGFLKRLKECEIEQTPNSVQVA